MVYNYAHVPPRTLDEAESRAAKIYARAGIEMDWLDCPLKTEEAARYPQCLLPPEPDRVALRVVAGRMGKQFGLGSDVFGVASFPTEGGFGVVALACAECSERLAHGRTDMYGTLLGYVMAHELGHLLLGTGSHGPAGVMCGQWRHRELLAAAQGALLFNTQEAEKMRRQVGERLRVTEGL